MIQTSISLFLSLFLAAGPVAAQTRALHSAAPLSATSVSAAAGSVSAVAALVDSAGADPRLLAPLATDASPASAYARALIAAPTQAAASSARAEAIAALGEPAVARLELSVRAMTATASSSNRTRQALNRWMREFAAMSGSSKDDAFAVAGGNSSFNSRSMLARPKLAWRAVKQTAAAVVMATGLMMSPVVPAATPADAPIAAEAVQSIGRAVQASDINDAIAKWKPGVHLIVIGNPGLDSAAQIELAQWLADKHWTVLLVQSNAGMNYVDGEGRSHNGRDAVSFGAGQGIFKKSGFSSQIQPQSGLTDGSILAITMKEHALFLRNSQAQKDYGLDGETQFPGNLDRWAKDHLRHGGDITGAVKETVTNIDANLNSAVAQAASDAAARVASAKSALAEMTATRSSFEKSHAAATVGRADLASLNAQVTAAEKALAAKRWSQASQLAGSVTEAAGRSTAAMSDFNGAFGAAQTALTTAQNDVDALETASGKFLKNHPKASGDLARPDIRGMRERLAAAAAAVESNPASSRSTAQTVTAEIRRSQDALAAHAAGADQLANANSVLKGLQDRKRASSASTELVAATQALREAREAYDTGASAWSSNLANAKQAIASAETIITEADVAAHRRLMILLSVLTLLSLGTAGLGIFLNSRARKARAVAEEELAKWDAILEKKLDTVIDELDRRGDVYIGSVSGAKARNWTGKTAELAAAYRSDAGQAKLLLGKARATHDEATALVRPSSWSGGWLVNLFWPSRYQQAMEHLSNQPLAFKPGEGLDTTFGQQKKDWREDLYGSVDNYKAFSKTFSEVIAEFNARAQTAAATLDQVEKAATTYGAQFDAVQQQLDAVEATRAAVEAGAAKYGYFAVPSLYTVVKSHVEGMLAAARTAAVADPVGSLRGDGAAATALIAEATSLINSVRTLHAERLNAANAVIESFKPRNISSDWIAADLKKLSVQAEAAAAGIASGAPAGAVAAFVAAADERFTYFGNAGATVKSLTETWNAKQQTDAATADAHRTISSALKLDASQTLKEKQAIPEEYLAKAQASLSNAESLLGEGNSESAQAVRDAQGLIAQASAIVTHSLESLTSQAPTLAQRRAETSRLTTMVPERQHVLDGIVKDFADSVMLLGAGDLSHPNANGTVADNVDEAEAALAAANAKTDAAVKAYNSGSLLAAADLLAQVLGHQQTAEHRLSEIAEKRDLLDKTVAANKTALEALESKFRGWKTEIPDDRRTMAATIQSYENAGKTLLNTRTVLMTGKGDPFKAAATLATVTKALEQLWVSTQNDRDAYAEVERALSAARTQLNTGASLAKDAAGDGVTDSRDIVDAERDLTKLEAAYTSAVAAAKVDHGDWVKLDATIHQIITDAAHAAAVLKSELAAAAKATSAITTAAAAVREATNWSGSYGVSVPGSPGSGSVQSARSALNSGDYAGAIRYADSARREAQSAIDSAEAEETRRRRAAEAEAARLAAIAAAERRRREEEEESRRSSSSGSSSGFGGSSSSGGGGSSFGGSSSGGGDSSW
jgi:hypothetical protein